MKTLAIHWESTVSGSIGTGTKLFVKEEAERLARELNEKYPDIDHEAVIPVPRSAEPSSRRSSRVAVRFQLSQP